MAFTMFSTRYSRVLIVLAAIVSMILLSLPFLPNEAIAEIGLKAFMGRLHPLMVHFPIVLIVLALIVEGVGYLKKRQHIGTANVILIPLAVLSSCVAVFMGYFLYRSGAYSGNLVEQHFWGGIWLAVICIGAGLAYYFSLQSKNANWRKAYIGLLILANVLTLYTGHLGGSLTHGKNYLTDALPDIHFASQEFGEKESIEEMLVFDDVIMGIFDAKCMSCHNAYKAKGGLIMKSYGQILAGGKSEKSMLVALSPDSSELFHRISLDETHDDHMPPSGKPDLNEEEIEIIKRWIEEGADPKQKLIESSLQLQQLAKSQLPSLMRFQRKLIADRKERDETLVELQELVKHLHLRVEPDPEVDSMLFSISMQFPPALVNDETLVKLLPYAGVFSKLSLPSAEITDEGLYTISQFSNLRELYLQKTCVKGDGIIYLKSLPNLKDLSLAYTEVDDYHALEFLDFKSLENLYLYQTEVGVNVVHALNLRMAETSVLSTEGPYY